MENVYVGRQPIYNDQLEVVAYQLLFRNSEQNSPEIDDGKIDNLSALGPKHLKRSALKTLLGTRKFFINLTQDFHHR